MVTNVSEYRFKTVPAKESRLSDVVWFHELNPRGLDQYGEQGHVVTEGRLFVPTDKVLQREIVANFVSFGGWDPIQVIHVQRLTDEQVAEGVRRREAEYERLKAAAVEDPENHIMLQVFRHFFCDGKGNVLPPKWMGIDCNRRGSQILASWTALAKIEKGNLEALQCILPLACPDTKDQRFEHDDFRIVCATRENDKTVGFKPMTIYDKIRLVYKLAVNGGRSTGWVEKNLGIKGSDRVIILGWARFIQYCEVEMDWGLRLWERCNPANRYLKDANGSFVMQGEDMVEDPSWIDVKKFGQLAWQGPTVSDHPYCHYAMGAMTDISKDLQAFNKEREKNGKPAVMRPIGAEGKKLIEDWLAYFNDAGSKGTSKKIMMKTDIERLKAHDNKIGRDMASAIFDNDQAALTLITERSYVSNYVHDVAKPVYAEFEGAVKALKRAELTEEESITLWIRVKDLVGEIAAARPKEEVAAE